MPLEPDLHDSDAAVDAIGCGDPGAIPRVELAPFFWELPEVLTPAECQVLIDAARILGSLPCELDEAPTPDAQAAIDYLRRVVALHTRLPVEHQESFQIHHYGVDETCDIHREDFAAGSEHLRFEAERGGQRVFSFMVFLNDVDEGGATEFPALGLAVPPDLGKGILWANVAEDGRPYSTSLHSSLPVVKGEKWVLVGRIREAPVGQPVPGLSISDLRGLDTFVPPELDRGPASWIAEENERQRAEVPFLNAGGKDCRGFERRQLDPKLFAKVQEAFRSITSELLIEEGDSLDAFVGTVRKDLPASLYQEVPGFNPWIHELLQPLHEEWCRFPLTPSACYGFRVYLPGAYLHNHVDRPHTHVISSTLCVDAELYAPWPLHAVDADGRNNELDLEPGELLLYESAHILHGRPVPMNGRYSAGLFIHYQPAQDHDLWMESPRAWFEKHQP